MSSSLGIGSVISSRMRFSSSEIHKFLRAPVPFPVSLSDCSSPQCFKISPPHVTGTAPCWISAFAPREVSENMGPGIANTSRLYSVASRAVMRVPESSSASIIRTPRAIPAMRRFLCGNVYCAARSSGSNSDTRVPPAATIFCKYPFDAGKEPTDDRTRERNCSEPAASAARCASASMPVRPETMTMPFLGFGSIFACRFPYGECFVNRRRRDIRRLSPMALLV